MRQQPGDERWRIVDRWNTSFWSGEDLEIYAEDIHLEQAIQVSYQIAEQVHPYFGYASFVADRMHHGTRLITGELSMNYVREGYLWSLLSYLRQKENSSLPGNVVRGGRNIGGEATDVRPAIPFVNQPWGPQLADLGKASDRELQALLDRRRQVADMDNRRVNTQNGESTYPPDVLTSAGLFSTRENGFDLNIIYGGTLNAAQALRFRSEDGYSLEDPSVVETDNPLNPSTGRKLVGVELMTSAAVTDDSGRPVIETYSFIARDVQALTSRILEN